MHQLHRAEWGRSLFIYEMSEISDILILIYACRKTSTCAPCFRNLAVDSEVELELQKKSVYFVKFYITYPWRTRST